MVLQIRYASGLTSAEFGCTMPMSMDLITIFVTGLLAGGLTCLAVQGGLLASSLAQQDDQAGEFVPILSFITTRLLAYTLLGALLGGLGSLIQPSLTLRIGLQVAVAIFMIGTALNLLQIHPIFRYFVLQPPRFLTRLVKDQARSKSVFGPALLGACTVFIPCGATQAMMAYAITTGSALQGALVMFAFIAGTSPLFVGIGYAARKLGTTARANVNTIAAIAILFIALYNLVGAANLSGFSATPQQRVKNEVVTDRATIYFTKSGYTTDPKVITVQGNTRLTLKLVNRDGGGCIQAFTIPKFGIQKVIPIGSSEDIVITTPRMSGPISFMCSMGMYQGVINVI